MKATHYHYLRSSEKKWYKAIALFNLLTPLLFAITFLYYNLWRFAVFALICQIVFGALIYCFKRLSEKHFHDIHVEDLPPGLYISKEEIVSISPVVKININSIKKFKLVQFFGLLFLKICSEDKKKRKTRYYWFNREYASYIKAYYQDTVLNHFVNSGRFKKIQSKFPPPSTSRVITIEEKVFSYSKWAIYMALCILFALAIQAVYKKVTSNEIVSNFINGIDDISGQKIYGQRWPQKTTRKITELMKSTTITTTSYEGLEIHGIHLMGKVECDVKNNVINYCSSESGAYAESFKTTGTVFIHFTSKQPYIICSNESTYKSTIHKKGQIYEINDGKLYPSKKR